MAKKRKRSRKAVAVVRHRPRARPHHRRRAGRRRGKAAGGRITIMHALVAGAVVGYALKQKAVTDMLDNIPGVKTFGAAAGIAAVGLGVDHFVYRNKWVRLIGVGGAVVAAYTMGQNEFKMPTWVGDEMGDPDDGLMIGDVEED